MGIATVNIKETWKRFHEWLKGQPDSFITVALIVTAVLGILVALTAPTEFKAILLAYWWFP